jgi:serine phosphatase RsbU (regulator of sigma subunit)
LAIPIDLPLGVKPGHPRHSIHVPLPPGFVLCLYTDGLVEWRGVVVDDNIEKLRRTVTAQAPEAVQQCRRRQQCPQRPDRPCGSP